MRIRPARSRDLVLFLNTWACRLSSAQAPRLIAEWTRAHRELLEELAPLTIIDPALPERAEQLRALHDTRIGDMRAQGLHNMSDAAASKTLHMLIPRLFVMWDKEIRRSAPDGYSTYLLQMHAVAGRFAEQAPVPAPELEDYLQQRLAYRVRKTLAKYLDEYNWYEAVGREQTAGPDDQHGFGSVRHRALPLGATSRNNAGIQDAGTGLHRLAERREWRWCASSRSTGRASSSGRRSTSGSPTSGTAGSLICATDSRAKG